MRLGLLVHLIRNRRWLAGLGLDWAGYAAEAVALGFGAVVVVAPLMQTGLLFALILGARRTRTKLRGRDWGSAAALVVGLTGFLLLARPEGGIARPAWSVWWPWLVALGIALVGAVAAGWRTRGAPRAVAWGLAAAICYGATGPLTKTVVELFTEFRLGSLVTSWELPTLIGVAAFGMLCNQSAFQAGNLPASLPAIAIGTPLFACAIGVAVYDEHFTATGPLQYALLVAAIAVMAVGIFVLAQGEARRSAADPPPVRP